MSSVSGVSGASSDWFQICQQAQTQAMRQSPASGGAAALQSAGLASATGAGQGKGHHHHYGLKSKIEDSVTSALDSADPTADPNQIIQDAITKALRDSQGSAASGAAAGSGKIQGAGSSGNQDQSFIQLLESRGVDAQQFSADLRQALASFQANGSLAGPAALAAQPTSSVDSSA